MDILERYKQLSNEDKSNLTIYTIYDSIYDVIKNKELIINDDTIKEIQEWAYELYLNDESNQLSANKIAFFITECYSSDKDFLSKLEDIYYDDFMQAVVDDNLNFYIKDELER